MIDYTPTTWRPKPSQQGPQDGERHGCYRELVARPEPDNEQRRVSGYGHLLRVLGLPFRALFAALDVFELLEAIVLAICVVIGLVVLIVALVRWLGAAIAG